MVQDLRQAFRTIAAYPLFSAVVVLSLTLGIGANTAVFSLLDQALLRTLPVKDPERVAVFHVQNLSLRGTSSSDNYETVFSLDMAKQFRARTDVFEGVGVRGGGPSVVLNGGTNEYIGVELISGDLLGMLGVGAALGRTISPDDDRAPGERPVAMLTYPSWIERFAGDPKIIGQTIRLNGLPFTVVGILPPNFHSAVRGNKPAVVVPVSMQRQLNPDMDGTARDTRWVNMFARLKPGVTRAQAAAAVGPTWNGILEGLSSGRGTGKDDSNRRLELIDASQGINPLNRSLRTPLFVLMGTVAALLHIACLNIAGLLLARAAARRRDIAIRLSLGAGRLRILRQALIENFVLAVVGCGLGVAIAPALTAGLLKLAGEGAESTLAWQLDARVVLFAAAVCLGTTLLFGAVPALQLAGADLARSLQNRSLPASHATVRKLLVGAQIALATLLLFGAGLFLRSLNNLMRVDPGFRAERLVQFDISPRHAGYDKVRGTQFYNDLTAKLQMIPGVTAAGGSNPGPMSGNHRAANMTIEGYAPPQGEDANTLQHATSPGFFRTLGVPLLAGRDFTEADREGAPPVVIVNEAFVKKYVNNGNPLGRKIAWGSGRVVPNIEIVGVVRNLRNALRDEAQPDVYIPLAQERQLQPMTFFLRTAADDRAISNSIRAAVRTLDANVPVDNIQTMRERIDNAASADRVLAILCTAFAAIAVLLTALGIYGVIAWTVARRTHEIAVRMALGAETGRVLRLVMRELALVALLSVGIGAVLGIFTGDFAESKLYGVQGRDAWMLAAAIATSLGVAVLATALPALRATRIQPASALRQD